MAEEKWKPFPGFEELAEISDHGRARTLDRLVDRKDNTQAFHEGRLLSTSKAGGVTLFVAGKPHTRQVRKMCYLAFGKAPLPIVDAPA